MLEESQRGHLRLGFSGVDEVVGVVVVVEEEGEGFSRMLEIEIFLSPPPYDPNGLDPPPPPNSS